MEGEQGCRNRIGEDNKEDNCRERIEDEETKPDPWKWRKKRSGTVRERCGSGQCGQGGHEEKAFTRRRGDRRWKLKTE